MTDYIVVSHPYEVVEPVMDDGSGPTYEARDTALVLNAPTRRAARWAAFRVWRDATPKYRSERALWPEKYLDYGTHPLAGMTLEPWPPSDEYRPDEFTDEDWQDAISPTGFEPYIADCAREWVPEHPEDA